jgi:hypothetical protein
MAVQYSPLPDFQLPNVNILGSLAQGQALQQNALQQQRLQQQMDLANMSAGYTARKESREADKAEMESRVKLQELKDKILEHARMQLQTVPENDDATYQAIIGQYKDILPDEYAIASKMKWNADTRKRFLLTPEQQYTQAKPTYKEYGGEVYKETPEGLVPAPILPAGGRGQAGAFNAPAEDNTAALVNQAKAGVARVESGSPQGNYGAVGPAVKRKDGVDHAYGKYQVMGANIPTWTKQALGKSLTVDEFLASPEAQERVFEDQFTRNVKKYGTLEDAVSVWFSGRPLAQATRTWALAITSAELWAALAPIRRRPLFR